MVPCILRKEVCKTIANVEIYDTELDEDGQPTTKFNGTVKGNFQQKLSQVINGNTRTQIKSGTLLVPAEYIPENNYSYCGGKVSIGKSDYIITDVIANYDLYGELNYWTIKTN